MTARRVVLGLGLVGLGLVVWLAWVIATEPPEPTVRSTGPTGSPH
jgi:hypothetical protein